MHRRQHHLTAWLTGTGSHQQLLLLLLLLLLHMCAHSAVCAAIVSNQTVQLCGKTLVRLKPLHTGHAMRCVMHLEQSWASTCTTPRTP